MEVKSIDVNSAKAEVKKCPKAVRDYVAALERRCESKQKLVDDAISELRKAQRLVKESDSLPCVSDQRELLIDMVKYVVDFEDFVNGTPESIVDEFISSR